MISICISLNYFLHSKVASPIIIIPRINKGYAGDEELVRRELVGSLIKLGNEVLDSDNLDVANFENRNRKIPSALRSLLDLLKSPEDVRSICDMFEDVYFGVASWSIAHPGMCFLNL